MRAAIIVSALLILVGTWGAAPVMSESRLVPDRPGLEGLAAHFENWSLDSESEVLLESESQANEWGRMCGTPPPTPEFLARTQRDLGFLGETMQGVSLEALDYQIPLVFHIVQRSDGTGRVSNERIAEQIVSLNREFRRFGVEFVLLEVRNVVKNGWYKKCLPIKKNGKLNRKYFKMTARNAVDPASTVNIYTCKPFRNVLGFGVLAGLIPEDDPANAIVMWNDIIAGGPYFGFQDGITLVHEMGHYFGLFHTFHPGFDGNPAGCDGEGDFVNDTPYEMEPAFFCVPRDSCPQEGSDPIENFMDYTDDLCRTKFTRGQRRRMEDMTFLYRPTLFGFE